MNPPLFSFLSLFWEKEPPLGWKHKPLFTWSCLVCIHSSNQKAIGSLNVYIVTVKFHSNGCHLVIEKGIDNTTRKAVAFHVVRQYQC